MKALPELMRSVEIGENYVRKKVKRRRTLLYMLMNLCRIPGSLQFGLENEIEWNRRLEERGFNTPEIVQSTKDGCVRKFVRGATLKEGTTANSLYSLGNLIGSLHSQGISLGGDTKLENFVLSDGKIFILDPEFAGGIGERDPILDLRTAIEQIMIYSRPIEYVGAFIKGYLEGGGNKDYLYKVKQPSYEFVFSPFANRLLRRIRGHNGLQEQN